MRVAIGIHSNNIDAAIEVRLLIMRVSLSDV